MQKKNMNISESEWKIMKVLWEKHDLTLKEITARLPDSNWSYTTIRTLVTRLLEKGAISADKQSGNFRYRAAVSESECREKETSRFLTRVFDGSVSMLVSTLTKDSSLSEEEKKKLIDLIEKMDS